MYTLLISVSHKIFLSDVLSLPADLLEVGYMVCSVCASWLLAASHSLAPRGLERPIHVTKILMQTCQRESELEKSNFSSKCLLLFNLTDSKGMEGGIVICKISNSRSL